MKKNSTLLLFVFLRVASIYAQESIGLPSMTTAWFNKVDQVLPLNEYPRPQLKREKWQNLNGKWNYSICPLKAKQPINWQGKILVPFPVESYLSGVHERVGANKALWYSRKFKVNDFETNKRVILHFGAIDYNAEILINGHKVINHKGGYTSFSQDITSYLNRENEKLVVKVIDPTDQGEQARGKQVKEPGGIYYTPVTGIWQTVWLEVVPDTYLESYKVQTNIKNGMVKITPSIYNGRQGDHIVAEISYNGRKVISKTFDAVKPIVFNLPNAKLWAPDHPNLYDLQLSIQRDEKTIDKVMGYFGMRDIRIAKDDKEVNRIFLNGKAVFQYGPLDQGYWPGGIYTAPTDKAMLSDIHKIKQMGFNMVRKHVKVEPKRWYYHCDKVGLIVWQDMPSGYGEIVPVKDHEHSVEGDWLSRKYEDVKRSYQSEKNFRSEWKEIINQFYNFPSICVWVAFNESWGQFKTNEILEWTKSLDSTRIVDGPSGWIDRKGGEVRDYHLYGDRLDKKFPLEKNRALVIGEFGGLGYAVKGHLYSKDAWSYQGFKNSNELETAYKKLIDRIEILKSKGFSAAVYTQLTDVETEINGLMTYDRKVIKIDPRVLKNINKRLYQKKN